MIFGNIVCTAVDYYSLGVQIHHIYTEAHQHLV